MTTEKRMAMLAKFKDLNEECTEKICEANAAIRAAEKARSTAFDNLNKAIVDMFSDEDYRIDDVEIERFLYEMSRDDDIDSNLYCLICACWAKANSKRYPIDSLRLLTAVELALKMGD